MNFDDPASLVSGIIIGLLGMCVFMFGKREGNPKLLGVGLLLCVFPYFVASLLLQWLITGGCVGLLYFTRDGAAV